MAAIDLIGTSEDLYRKGLIHLDGLDRDFPHYNVKFPKSQGGKDGLIRFSGC